MAHRDAPPFSKLHAQLLLRCPAGAPDLKRLLMMQALMKETEAQYERADALLLRPAISQYLCSMVSRTEEGVPRLPHPEKGEIGGHMAHLIRCIGLIPAERAADASTQTWVAIAKELQADPDAAKRLLELGEASEGILRAALGGILGYITSECARNGTPIRPWTRPRSDT